MTRIRLTIEYDGTNYAGWQRQENALAVQQVLEEALTKLLGVRTQVAGASRTDAGVHARGQVAHFDTQSRIPPEKFAYALNTLLPRDVRVQGSCGVPDDFHARFSAQGKLYRYVIMDTPHASALMRNLCAHVIFALDLEKMQCAASDMLGTHDFAAVAASGSVVKDTVRTVSQCDLTRTEGGLILLHVRGNGFLYNMVRILAGTLIDVGAGKLDRRAISRAIESRNRLDLGATAPARGLTLMQVYYSQGT